MTGFRDGVKDSVPIMAGYVPIAFAFGVSAVQSGLPPVMAVFISAVVFAGGSQFVLIHLFTLGGSVAAIVPTVLLLNVRHMFYGQPVVKRLAAAPRRRSSLLLAFGLTDEVFATAITKMDDIAPGRREGWYLGLELGAYLSWVAGTAAGAFAGAEMLARAPALKQALDFVLPAFFCALLLAMGKRGAHAPACAAMGITALALLWLPGSVAIILGMGGGALFGAVMGVKHGRA